MARAYSADMGERVIARVESGTSRREAAEHYEVSALATFRRKIDGFVDFDRWRDAKRSPSEWGLQDARSRAQTYGPDCFAMARPMLMRLSAITPRPTQRFMPALPL